MLHKITIEVISAGPAVRPDGSKAIQVVLGFVVPPAPEKIEKEITTYSMTMSSEQMPKLQTFYENKVFIFFDASEWEMVKKNYYVGASIDFCITNDKIITLQKVD